MKLAGKANFFSSYSKNAVILGACSAIDYTFLRSSAYTVTSVDVDRSLASEMPVDEPLCKEF
jgi:hypothetical protein